MFTQQSPEGFPVNSFGEPVAGTTQTQVGATALTKAINKVTTGNANDGVALPYAGGPAQVGQSVLVKNESAVILKVYPYHGTKNANGELASAAASGGTIDGGAADAALSQAASVARLYVCTAINTWKSILLS
jgi:hypothetical protein